MTDTIEPVETPIVVDPNPVPAQTWVAIRDVLKILGGILVTRGVLDAAQLETVIGVVLILGPVIWAQLKARKTVARLTVLAEAAPNSVGQVKG